MCKYFIFILLCIVLAGEALPRTTQQEEVFIIKKEFNSLKEEFLKIEKRLLNFELFTLMTVLASVSISFITNMTFVCWLSFRRRNQAGTYEVIEETSQRIDKK